MDPEKVIAYYGGIPQVAEALGITRMAVYKWRYAKRVPKGRAYELQILTGGKLRANQDRAA